MNTQHERFGVNAVILSLLALMVISGIVMAALAFDALWVIVGAIAVIGMIIVLSLAATSLIVRFSAPAIIGVVKARNESRQEDNRHEEVMVGKGLLKKRSAYQYVPQLEAPSDIPVSVSGETASTVAAYSEDALNLLALSLQWQRETGADPTQVVPYHAARKSDYFRDVAIWMRAVQFLLVNQIGVERMRGNRKMGTFVISGTVEQAYYRMRGSTTLPL